MSKINKFSVKENEFCDLCRKDEITGISLEDIDGAGHRIVICSSCILGMAEAIKDK